MTVIRDAWSYLTTWANWTGDAGMLHLMTQQLLLTVTALLIAMVAGLPLALWLGHLGRGGFLAINTTNIGRAVPTFALLALFVTADFPGTREFGPYGRAGLATLLALALFALPPLITNSYDAVFLLALAIEKSGAADRAGISAALREVANAPGETILPGEWSKAVELIKAGTDINYEGASGPIEFDEAGDVAGGIDYFVIEGGKIVNKGQIQ